jgi:hypothetical protein
MHAEDGKPTEYADTAPSVYGEDAVPRRRAEPFHRRFFAWALAGGFALGLFGLAWYWSAARQGY